MAADWHKLKVPQRTMRSSIARVIEQLDPQINHVLVCKMPVISDPTKGRRQQTGRLLDLPTPDG